MKNANPSIYLTHGYYCSVYGTRLVYQVVCPLSWQGEGAGGGGGGGEIRVRKRGGAKRARLGKGHRSPIFSCPLYSPLKRLPT